MIKSSKKLVKVGRKRRKDGRRDKLRAALLNAGRDLLANSDFDRLPVSRIASKAGCSVGAFYARFFGKPAYLDQLIHITFASATEIAKQNLDQDHWSKQTNDAVIDAIARHVVAAMRGGNAGVMRAAVRRGQHEPSALEPLLSYRSFVTERAVTLLAHRAPDEPEPRARVQMAMQFLHAIVLDSVLHATDPLKIEDDDTIDELDQLLACQTRLRMKPGPTDRSRIRIRSNPVAPS